VETPPTAELSGVPSVEGPSAQAQAEFSRLASAQTIRAVANALERSGITTRVVDSGEEARQAVRSLLPVGAEVYNNTSRTLEAVSYTHLTLPTICSV